MSETDQSFSHRLNSRSVLTKRLLLASIGAVSFGALGLLLGLIGGSMLEAARPAEATAIHVPALTNETVAGALVGGSLGLGLGIVTGLFAGWTVGTIPATRPRRVAGEVVCGLGAAMVCFPFHLLGAHAGMGIGVFFGGAMLGGRGRELDVLAGVVAGGMPGAGVFILTPDLGDVVYLARTSLAFALPFVGAVAGYERRAEQAIPAG